MDDDAFHPNLESGHVTSPLNSGGDIRFCWSCDPLTDACFLQSEMQRVWPVRARGSESHSFISSSSTHHRPPCQFGIKFTATFNTIIMIQNKLYSNLNSSHPPFWASVKPHVLSHHPATESENKLRMQCTVSSLPPIVLRATVHYWMLSLSQRTHKLSHKLFENATQTSFVFIIFIKIRNASWKQQHLLHCSTAHPLSPPTSGLKWDRQSGDSAESQLVKHPFCSLLLATII